MGRRINVKEGDYFQLAGQQFHEEAMQVMEIGNGVMTVKCQGGCLTKKLSEFRRVKSLKGRKVYNAPYFEDNRTRKTTT